MSGLRIAIAASALAMATLTFAQPRVEERWGLYLGSSADAAHAHLFLDPFPSRATCETRVKVFAANREHAYCGAHRRIEFGDAADDVLAADFDPLRPGTWLCPRYRKLAPVARKT